MAVYRITRFVGPNMDKAIKIGETVRELISSAGADFVDVASDGEGNGMGIARYPDQETMENATPIAQQAFGKMIEGGAVDGSSIRPWTGNVIMSF